MAGAGIHPYHQQWPPAAAAAPPPPPPAVAAAAPPPHAPPIAPSDEVRTIFITGLPEDVKERELQNLLRWLPGYEASQVNFKGEKPMGFALFSNAQFALAAKDALQEMVFDAESKSVLHTEMAKKNLFVKRGIVADSSPYDQSKRLRTGGDYTHTGYTSPSPFHPPPPAHVWGPHGYMAPPPPPPPYDPYGGYPVPPVPMPAPAPVPAPSSYVPVQLIFDLEDQLNFYLDLYPELSVCSAAKDACISEGDRRDILCWRLKGNGKFDTRSYYQAIQGTPNILFPWKGVWKPKIPKRVAFFLWTAAHNRILTLDNLMLRGRPLNAKDNPPCNTLFIGNLGENINEEELRGLFSAQPGFKQMKVLRQERHTVCFIEFEDVNSASNVHHSLQGAVIPSSGSVGMRIQYPFSILDKKKKMELMWLKGTLT
uniref:RRM domain-containing protein n=1 Tax=Quercus lobata TaxID=97700 RepID=A0A7N2LUH1_QUELO